MSDSRFAMVQAQYRSLRTAFDAGRIDAAAFEAALDATAFEHAGRWWYMTGTRQNQEPAESVRRTI